MFGAFWRLAIVPRSANPVIQNDRFLFIGGNTHASIGQLINGHMVIVMIEIQCPLRRIPDTITLKTQPKPLSIKLQLLWFWDSAVDVHCMSSYHDANLKMTRYQIFPHIIVPRHFSGSRVCGMPSRHKSAVCGRRSDSKL